MYRPQFEYSQTILKILNLECTPELPEELIKTEIPRLYPQSVWFSEACGGKRGHCSQPTILQQSSAPWLRMATFYFWKQRQVSLPHPDSASVRTGRGQFFRGTVYQGDGCSRLHAAHPTGLLRQVGPFPRSQPDRFNDTRLLYWVSRDSRWMHKDPKGIGQMYPNPNLLSASHHPGDLEQVPKPLRILVSSSINGIIRPTAQNYIKS